MRDYLKRQQKLFTKKEQEKIKNLNVVVAGAGGLGTNLALQLQRIGINRIYLYDYDQVELSNLNRQLCYGRDDIGSFKVEAAAEFLQEFKLDTEIIAKKEKIDLQTELPAEIDIIFDALDNFKSRLILDQLAEKYQLPFIHTGVEEFFIQIMLITPESRIRLSDVFSDYEPSEPPAVFSPVVTAAAAVEVMEALKYLLAYDNYLKNQLLYLDLLSAEIEKIELS